MNKEKQKRYLCDFFDYLDHLRGVARIFYCIGFITVCIAFIALFTYLNFNYNPEITNIDWRNSYEEEKEQYTYLYDIFENIIHEGEIPNVEAIPDGVFYDLTLTNDNNTFYYSLDSKIRSESKYYMKVTFSEDMRIIDKECSVTLVSEDEYKQIFNRLLKFLSVLYGCFHFLFILLLFLVCYLISCAHKHIDSKRKLNNIDL